MTNIESVLNTLTEVTATSISRQEKPETFEANKNVAVRGGKAANTAKEEYEKATGLKGGFFGERRGQARP